MNVIGDLDALHALYGTPAPPALCKEVPALTAEYRALIAAAPFCALATVGPEGIDCSPRGDKPGFVRVLDDRTLALPDRFGNNRIDSLRNIVRDPRVALMFLVPGWGNALRVNGRAGITADEAFCAGFAVDGRAPRSVAVVAIDAVYFQCARAIIRSGLWGDMAAPDLPTPGRILAAITAGEVGGAEYDAAWPARASTTMW